MTAQFQLTDEEWSNLRQCFPAWLEEKARNLSKFPRTGQLIYNGRKHISTAKAEKILRGFYEGWGMHVNKRNAGCGSVTIYTHYRRFCAFLAENPHFKTPVCACGKPLWHRGLCPIRDTYHRAAITKGHLTQAKLAQQRYADEFFINLNNAKAMTTTLEQPKQQLIAKIETFSSLVQQGIDAWTRAGALLVEMIESDPKCRESIIEQCPDITEEILSRFEAIGRKQIHPQTLLNNSPGMRRLRRLPYSEQARYVSEPVELLVQKPDGPQKLKVAIKNLTANQAMQVFGTHGVRTPEAQRAWLESNSGKKAAQAPATPYTIHGRKVIFNAGCEVSARELATILAQISG